MEKNQFIEKKEIFLFKSEKEKNRKTNIGSVRRNLGDRPKYRMDQFNFYLSNKNYFKT
jgi:hypothetical protein